MTKPISY